MIWYCLSKKEVNMNIRIFVYIRENEKVNQKINNKVTYKVGESALGEGSKGRSWISLNVS